jgi:4-hydroxy-tetrahydrodipicolinate reductase
MKIALLGYGKMGVLIEKLANDQGHPIVARFSQSQQKMEDLNQADIAIDFSHPSAVLDHVKLCCHVKKPLVIGTTGWEKELAEVKSLVNAASIGCLAASNFSIGVHLFQAIVREAAALFASQPLYDVAAIEYHHNQKVDRPSGTALLLIEEIKRQMPYCSSSFQFESVRCGQIPGTHEIIFDSAADTITLTHQARNREGFAQGALLAAAWLLPKQGYFILDDFLNATLPLRKNLCNCQASTPP